MTSVIEILSSPRAVEPMADSVNGENTTPSLKRKASVDGECVRPRYVRD